MDTHVCKCGDALQPCGGHVEIDPQFPCEDCLAKLKSNDDILWVGFDETDLEMIESAMGRILESSGNSIARRRAQDVIVTIESARAGDWTPTNES